MKLTKIDDNRWLINPCGDVAATIKTSNHRWRNITQPRGGERRWAY